MTTFAEPAEGQPRRASIWPAVENSILDLGGNAHVDDRVHQLRRVCERMSSRLNELAADEQASDEVPAQVMATAGTPRILPPSSRGRITAR